MFSQLITYNRGKFCGYTSEKASLTLGNASVDESVCMEMLFTINNIAQDKI